jgi:hypothetical protein
VKITYGTWKLTDFLCRGLRRIGWRGERRHSEIVFDIKVLFEFTGVLHRQESGLACSLLSFQGKDST